MLACSRSRNFRLDSCLFKNSFTRRCRFRLPAPRLGPEMVTSSVMRFLRRAMRSARSFSFFLSRLRRVGIELFKSVPYAALNFSKSSGNTYCKNMSIIDMFTLTGQTNLSGKLYFLSIRCTYKACILLLVSYSLRRCHRGITIFICNLRGRSKQSDEFYDKYDSIHLLCVSHIADPFLFAASNRDARRCRN